MKSLPPIFKKWAARLALALGAATASAGVMAAGGGALPYSYEADVDNLPSVQRGAKYYMAYCSGCHSMQFMRYSRIASDLEIPEQMLQDNLMFTGNLGRLDGEYAFGPGTQRTTSITVNLAASAEAAREQRNPDTRLHGHYHIATTDRVGLQPEYTGRRCR